VLANGTYARLAARVLARPVPSPVEIVLLRCRRRLSGELVGPARRIPITWPTDDGRLDYDVPRTTRRSRAFAKSSTEVHS